MGPFSYKTDLQETKKCWILLFTCLNCRAILIDILHSLSAHAFLHSLRRFIATYGCPKRIICDNAPAFKTFAELQSEEQIEERSEDLLDYCATNKIDFKFIPAFSPWQGALYERMIGIFKSAFFHAVKHHTLPLDDLHTIAKESEAICNSRPLTYTTDQTDFLPLRPVDFVRPTARLSGPQLDDECEWKPQYTTKDELLYNWQFSLKLLDNFWNRWQAEYLTSLRERHQITHPHPRSYHNDKPVQGEYVLIHDENHPRGTWKMGQICGSSDNFSRSVQIRLPSKRIITRPINLISRFEIDSNETIRKETPQDESSTTRSSHPMITRSRKKQLLLPNLLSLAIMMSFLQPTTSTNTRCPDELTIGKKIIYATPCVANGIAVATYSDHDKTQLCWFPVMCPSGQIQNVTSIQRTPHLCGPSCKCPQWTQFCSHYNGERIQQSKIFNIPPDFRNFIPNEVCSFPKSSSCDPKKKVGVFNQIELYDGRHLLVPNIHVSIKDYLDTNDFVSR
ncbi:unnamed protein product [Nippostrongylus brasiliensis]|uniref:Integrase catalytic domain-containing protein n=1 Tax=Nippostrongylus brasiliensis TaxID=27835 RepID=A0A0N4YD05_NIPBR|nr:unnamed protein product [Nippostrongylus brasiliensis]